VLYVEKKENVDSNHKKKEHEPESK